MKKTTVMMLSLLSVSAFAAPTRTQFICDYKEGAVKAQMSFVAQNLEIQKKVTIEADEARINNGDQQHPILFKYVKKGTTTWTTPKEPYDYLLSAALNGGDASDLFFETNKNGKVLLSMSVGDDCVDAKFSLYQNSKYTSGYFSGKNNCDPKAKLIGSPMICKTTKL